MILKISVAVGSPSPELVEGSRTLDLPASAPHAGPEHTLEAHVRAATACVAEQLCRIETSPEGEFVPLANVLETVAVRSYD